MTLNKDGLEAARNAVGTIPGAALWSAVEKAITAYLSALPAPDGLVERLDQAVARCEEVLAHSTHEGLNTDFALMAKYRLSEAAAVIQTLQRERDELVGERDAALREAQDKDIRYRTWREFYGALLAVPASSATPLEVRAHRQANIITDMQYRIKCLRQEIRRHIRRDHLDPPMKGYRIGQHVNKLHKLWRDAESFPRLSPDVRLLGLAD